MTVEELHQLDVHTLKARFDERDTAIAQRDETISELTDANTQLQQQVRHLTKLISSKKAERHVDPNQKALPFTTDGEHEATAGDAAQTETFTTTRRKPKRGKRQPIPSHWPRVERLHDLPEDQKVDPATGETLRRIGEEVSEQIDHVPAQTRVIRHVRPIYARPGENLDGQSPEVITAPRPKEGLPKCLAAPGLLAHIAVSKYADHLPLHRLEQMFRRSGFELDQASMGRWMHGVAELADPLLGLMKRRMLEHSHVIQSDETPVKQQDPGRGKTKECRFWPYLGEPGTAGHYVLFDYSQGRGGEHPRRWFEDGQGGALFAGGVLQGDGYAGINALFDPKKKWRMTRVGCWAHARRKFYDARKSGHAMSKHALGEIQKLYAVEREARERPPDERRDARQEHATPIVAAFFTWCREQQPRHLPKSDVGKAFTYALNQEPTLRVYLDDGRVQIDNNACERSLRGIGIGRKNWLFIGSPRGGQTAARLFGLLGSAKLHGVEPLAYLTDVITRLPAEAERGEEAVARFLPEVWAASHPESVVRG